VIHACTPTTAQAAEPARAAPGRRLLEEPDQPVADQPEHVPLPHRSTVGRHGGHGAAGAEGMVIVAWHFRQRAVRGTLPAWAA